MGFWFRGVMEKEIQIMKKLKLFWELYYPVVLKFLSFLYSVSLWFTGNKLEGIFVGIWVPSILAITLQLDKEEMTSLEKKSKREDIEIEKEESNDW